MWTAVLLVLLGSTAVFSASLPTNNKRVVIIGAGISGLGAANRLLQKGINNIVILEATGRAGGRIKSLHLTQDGYKYALEIGAGWIHGITGNPVYKLAKDHGLLKRVNYKKPTDVRYTECVKQYRKTNAKVIPRTIWKPVLQNYNKVIRRAESFYQESMPSWINKEEDDLGSFIEEEAMKLMPVVNAATTELQRKILHTRLTYETSLSACDSMTDVSLAYIGSYEEFSGGDMVFPNQGYDSVITALKANVSSKIQLNHVVSNIDYSDDKVTVTCENGAVFTADHVIVTASLGYLKENAASMFTPALPQEKINAIQRLGFGTVNRIYIEFDNLNFIPNRRLCDIWTVQDKYDDEVTAWEDQVYTFYLQNTPRMNVLTTWMTGKEAEDMEKESDDTVKDKIQRVLGKFLGVAVPRPIKITRTAWMSEDFVRGSYTFVKVGSSVSDIAKLAAPIKNSNGEPQVLFAGEATHQWFYSTTHGALISGRQAAKKIIDVYFKK